MLIKAIENTDGPILEMGMGVSTWVIEMMCKQTKRPIFSYENDPKWYAEFTRYASDYHRVLLIDDWDNISLGSTKWSVALIDHRPAIRRHKDAVRLKDNAEYILLHDSEPEIDRFYKYSRIYPQFKYHFTYDKCKPYTSVVSNFADPSLLC